MKILMIGPSTNTKGGMASVVKNLLNSQLINSLDIKFIASTIDGILIKRILYNFQSFIKIFSTLILKKHSIVHIHMASRGSFYRKSIIIKFAKMMNKKVIIHLHGACFKVFFEEECSEKQRKYIKSTFEKCDKVIVLGDKWRDFIENIVPENKIVVLNNSVKVPESTATFNKEKINILFLAVLTKRKGIYDLIESIKLLNDKGIVREKNLNFIIGGTGEEEENIKYLIQKYNLDFCIDMAGWVDGEKKIQLLETSQIFMLPSYNEGLPMAILEAMSYGIPVISTDVGSIAEAVKNDETGFLIEPGNSEEIAEAVTKIVTNEEIWKKQSLNCKNLIKSKFNEDEYINEINRLYKSI